MRKRYVVVGVTVVAAAALLAGTALAATVDVVSRTVTSSSLFVDWDDTNPEAIQDLRWNGSANLTNSAVNPNCPDTLEFFGNAWVSQDEGTPGFVFVSLVGWGSTGTWSNPSHNRVTVDSASTGCPGSAGVPVQTNYRFFDHGPVANRLQVERRFMFGSTPFELDFRPYIPRLHPRDAYTQVLHPDASGTSLLTEDPSLCEFGCRVTDWNDAWFAIHNPATGQGLILRRDPSGPAADLWVDQDQASFTNASSVLLLQPGGGFTGTLVESEFLCFYDSGTWTPSTTLPAGC